MIFYFFFLFVLGAIVGSFLNVVVLRLNTGRSIVHGRSQCFSCGKVLGALDLVPIASFLFLQGKCRFCKSKISSQYIFVEMATAILFCLSGVSGIPETPLLWLLSLLSLILVCFFVVIFVYDARHKIIPDVLSYGAATVALVYTLVLIFGGGDSLWRIAAGPIAALPFFFFWLVSRGRWMGLGDAKLTLSIGWWLGVYGALGAIIVAVFSGAIAGIFILFSEKIRKGSVKWGRHEIPFGPFLVLGSFTAYFFAVSVWTFLKV